ncbi:MAG: 2-hydroxyacyl-CoA dehydratase subunit D [Thermodesulfobacteriota bacterium]
MMDFFRKTAAGITNPHVEDWIKRGGRVIGYTCSLIPPEIFHAAGLLPFRLRGIGTTSMETGDAYYGPYVCTFPKCLLQLAGRGDYGFLAGAVVSTGCDSMRRLDECWRKAGRDFPGILPEFFHYFDAPHKTEPHAAAWFEGEIRRLIRAVESFFGADITDEKLKESICVYNKTRRLICELEDLRAAENPVISGEDAFCAILASSAVPPEKFNEHMEHLLDELRSKKATGGGKAKKRLMLAGSINDDPGLMRLIEEAGAAVVADSICFGTRGADRPVDAVTDPVAALGQKYLAGCLCPRMFGEYDRRLNALAEKLTRSGAEGIILQNIRFCDLHGSENSLLEKDLEKNGIPCLKLEREYGPLTDTGRMKMRIEAFVEQIS